MVDLTWVGEKKNKLRRAGTHLARVFRRHPRIIVSMTSYPARINTVHFAIRTLLAQKDCRTKLFFGYVKAIFQIGKMIFPNR